MEPNVVLLMKAHRIKRRGQPPKKEGHFKKSFATLKCRYIRGYMTKRRRGGTEELKSTACKITRKEWHTNTHKTVRSLFWRSLGPYKLWESSKFIFNICGIKCLYLKKIAQQNLTWSQAANKTPVSSILDRKALHLNYKDQFKYLCFSGK